MKTITITGEEGDENSHIEEIIDGAKEAFCTPEAWYGIDDEEPAAVVGDQIALLDPSGSQRVLIEITQIKTIPFGSADETLARAELDCDLQDFRDAHRFYWEEDLGQEGIPFNDDLKIVVEYFKIIKIIK